MTKQEQQALTLGFIRLSDTLDRAEDALQNGSVDDALDQLHQVQRTVDRMRPTEVSVAQASSALEVSAPTVRAWARRGLLDVVRDRPMTLGLASVITLRDRLRRLRETAVNEKRWQALLAEAADQREFRHRGAREGLADALAGDTVPLKR